MLKQLQAVIQEKGMIQVCHDLGYRSQTTIRKWINNGEIPKIAQAKVNKYLAKGKK